MRLIDVLRKQGKEPQPKPVAVAEPEPPRVEARAPNMRENAASRPDWNSKSRYVPPSVSPTYEADDDDYTVSK